jgi:hypothetical protein
MHIDAPTGTTPQKKVYPQSMARWSLVPTSRSKAIRLETKRKLLGEENGTVSDSMTFTDESDSNHDDIESDREEVDTRMSQTSDAEGEGSADQTFTKARMAIAPNSTTSTTLRKPIRPSSVIPLRDTTNSNNRLSMAKGGGTMASKIRQPSAPSLTGLSAKRARQ